ncbi:MAG TPA: hypothetical protein VF520_11715 [Thermoleophilaceae bacterium]|jgi:hypothetical protein
MDLHFLFEPIEHADGARAAARLGAWWGLGHAATLLLAGLPAIVLKSTLPGWLESGAETAVGVVILVLAARVIYKWLHGDYRSGRHAHPATSHRHLRRGTRAEHGHRRLRTPGQAMGIGVLHGLAGLAWLFTRPLVEPVFRAVLVPGFGAFGVVFGAWYAGLA